uniref:E4 n=1 Tax=human papillomavirus 91 TaxID=202252 RepID=A0A7G2AAG7_9PAPI|nr:E4 [human papillomavirus 91]CAD1807723.1 E4 [human papillomavirus 91]CAD1814583.1 E4 [human papillomavirus 91]
MGILDNGTLLWAQTSYLLLHLYLVLSPKYPLLRLLNSTPEQRPPSQIPRAPKKTTRSKRRLGSECDSSPTQPRSPVPWPELLEESHWTVETHESSLSIRTTTKEGTVVEVTLRL